MRRRWRSARGGENGRGCSGGGGDAGGRLASAPSEGEIVRSVAPILAWGRLGELGPNISHHRRGGSHPFP